VSLRDLYTAWREARRGKKPSANQLHFEGFWIDNLIGLLQQLNAGTWRPLPPTCFIAKHAKAREIHAPDFSDRVVHHWLVPQLEQVYERVFIHDSFSNRAGKGTHAAVERLVRFVRQVESGQGRGYYVQLDIRNFFNSIHRPTLWAMLKRQLQRAGVGMAAQRAAHALLRHSPLEHGVHYASTPAERARIPAHKQLANAAAGCGIAIGNLSSQFFANVYLNELDQFVKHELKAPRYIRYVDDFVLVSQCRQQLVEWKAHIEAFLADRLKLELKQDSKLDTIGSGIDFLGYIVRPTHLLVRRRVIHHARQKLQQWEARHVHGQHAGQQDLEQLRSVWSSYTGHFSHAASGRLHERIHEEFPWLRGALLAAAAASKHIYTEIRH
jgi:retron-type reverse transcriptase